MSGLRFSRRGFLQRATAVASVTAINARTASANAKPRYPMGLQLYTVRDPMAQDAAGTLKTMPRWVIATWRLMASTRTL